METSVWGALEDAAPAYFPNGARALFARGDQYEFFISPVVAREITDAPAELRERLMRAVAGVKPTPLRETEDINSLAAAYIRRGIFPAAYRDDALHVAFASYYALDFLVSYNFRHIVSVSRRELVRAANTVLGYRSPVIVTPDELAAETWEGV